MNQLEKILFWNKKYSLVFLCCHFFIIFIPLCHLLGYVLWLQSFILAVIGVSFFFFMFSYSFHHSFKSQEIKGYDSWHLKPLKDQYLNEIRIKIISHHLPFFITYDFLGQKQILFSSEFLKKFQHEEIKRWFIFLMFYFKTGASRKATLWSYFFFLILSPFFWIEKLSDHTRIKFFQKIFKTLYSFLFFLFTLPFLYVLRKHFYKMDREGSQHFTTRKQYAEGLLKIQHICKLHIWNKNLCFSPLFPINILTHSRFYPNIHPNIKERIQAIGEKFPI